MFTGQVASDIVITKNAYKNKIDLFLFLFALFCLNAIKEKFNKHLAVSDYISFFGRIDREREGERHRGEGVESKSHGFKSIWPLQSGLLLAMATAAAAAAAAKTPKEFSTINKCK